MTARDQTEANVNAFESVVKVAAFGGGAIRPLEEWYSLAPIQPSGGFWYFAFNCPVCLRASPLFRDFSDGHLGKPFKGCGVRLICHFCKAPVRCSSEVIRPIEWPLAPGQTPPRSEYAHRVERKYIDDVEYEPLVGSLHHYTSVTALSSILKSKTFWATNIRYLDDSSESALGFTRMRQVAEEARETASGIDAEILTYLIDWLDGPQAETASVYVLSFSKDHNRLSQWRGFTTYGEGVCISLNSALLIRTMQARGWTFQNCRYNQASQLTWADAILSRIRREAATKYSGIESAKKLVFDSVLQGCLSDLSRVSATIKHAAFVDESEVRFISPLIDISDDRVSYRARPGKTTRIPYIEFPLTDGVEGSIEEVMVGPGPEQQDVRSSIITRKRECSIKSPWDVRLSDIPYRELP